MHNLDITRVIYKGVSYLLVINLPLAYDSVLEMDILCIFGKINDSMIDLIFWSINQVHNYLLIVILQT